jgi:hypothetical protein
MLVCLHEVWLCLVYLFCYLKPIRIHSIRVLAAHRLHDYINIYVVLPSHLSTLAKLLLFYCYNFTSSPLCFVFCCILQKCLRLTCFFLNLLLIFNNCLN